MDWRKFVSNLVSSNRAVVLRDLLVFVLGLFGALATGPFLKLTEAQHAQLIYILFCVSLIIMLVWIILCAVHDALRTLAASDGEKHETMSLAAVPRRIRCKHREDIVRFNHDESADFLWDLTLQSEPGDSIARVLFPITFERAQDPSCPVVPISVTRLRVNGKEKVAKGAYKRRQTRFIEGHNELVMEDGLVEIPVDLGFGTEECSVQIEMKVYCAFPKCREREYVVVDIPYLTEHLTVKILCESKLCAKGVARDHGEEVLEASNIFMETFDIHETKIQHINVTLLDDQVIWRTAYPKLGYRYKVWFRIEGLADQPPQV